MNSLAKQFGVNTCKYTKNKWLVYGINKNLYTVTWSPCKIGCINSFYPICLYVYVTTNTCCILQITKTYPMTFRKYFICLCKGFWVCIYFLPTEWRKLFEFRVCESGCTRLFWYFKMELLFHPNTTSIRLKKIPEIFPNILYSKQLGMIRIFQFLNNILQK